VNKDYYIIIYSIVSKYVNETSLNVVVGGLRGLRATSKWLGNRKADVALWRSGYGVRLAISRSQVRLSAAAPSGSDPGQVVHINLPLLPSGISGTGQSAVMSCGWEGNRKSGVALTMRHRLVQPTGLLRITGR